MLLRQILYIYHKCCLALLKQMAYRLSWENIEKKIVIKQSYYFYLIKVC